MTDVLWALAGIAVFLLLWRTLDIIHARVAKYTSRLSVLLRYSMAFGMVLLSSLTTYRVSVFEKEFLEVGWGTDLWIAIGVWTLFLAFLFGLARWSSIFQEPPSSEDSEELRMLRVIATYSAGMARTVLQSNPNDPNASLILAQVGAIYPAAADPNGRDLQVLADYGRPAADPGGDAKDPAPND